MRHNFTIEVSALELVEGCLELHELDLEVLVRLIMVGNEVVDGFEEGG